jgi:hypothetical protein
MRAPKLPDIRGLLAATALVLAPTLALDALAACGDFNDDGNITAVDALGILNSAIGIENCEVYECDVDGNGRITATDALHTLETAVGGGGMSNCPDDPNLCLNDIEFFFQRVWTPILTDCVACHNAQGIAANTDHVLQNASEEGYLEHNFAILRTLHTLGKGDLLLSKPLGIAHTGGRRLGMTEGDANYQSLEELIVRFDQPVTDCGNASDYWTGITHLSQNATLHKAAILFAGRRPTASEEQAVDNGGETELRKQIRRMMEGENFENFLRESVNDRLLTDKFRRRGKAFGVLQGEYQYPDLYTRINLIRTLFGDEDADRAYERTNEALAREPLELFTYIARKEKPYTHVVTADYMLVNPWSSAVYKSGASFDDDWDDDEWRRGSNRGYRLSGYPHAGVLSSPMFLNRFPSTATNRNRARARWISKFFLGVDIEALSPRTIDPSAIEDTDNPTMNNPACTVCHVVMDPIAGTLQNFGDDGIYLENDEHSLPRSYTQSDLFQDGDHWYRDMRKPGFGSVEMPESETDRSISWLGQQIAADPLFARGAVEFWYEGVFGRAPAPRPTDPSQADYTARLAAFAAQSDEFDDIAREFRDGTAGTGRHGPYNLKDLLVEIAISPLFTATAALQEDADRETQVDSLGLVKLLSPEQLNRKFESVTGYRWARSWDPDNPELLGRYRLFYGGIDSDGIIERADELNALMSTVPQRMAFETACPIAVKDFSLDTDDRLLFPFVEPQDLPGSPAGDAAIRTNIAWLHQWLLGDVIADDDPEVDRAFALFNDVRNLRIAESKPVTLNYNSGYCALDFGSGDYITRDDDHTIRAWIAVLVYLMNDYRFLYE